MADRDGFRQGQNEEEARKFDPVVHAVTVLQEQHRLGHDGFMAHVSGKITGLIDTGVHDFLCAVPADTYPHLQIAHFSLGRGDVDVETYEGTTTSADGSVLSQYNTNRNSAITNAAVWTTGPTVSAVGTLLHTTWVAPTATGTGQSAEGVVSEGQGEEWIFAPSTKYLVRLRNNSGAQISFQYEFVWYEIGYSR